VNDHIGHFGRGRNLDAEPVQVFGIQMQELVLRVADLNDRAARHEARAEFLNHRLDERALPRAELPSPV